MLFILNAMEEHDPIVVGGQAVNIWGRFYRNRSDVLARLHPLTSEDMDFHANPSAMKELGRRIGNAVTTVPEMGDASPSAGVVAGELNGRRVRVDFLSGVLGVEDSAIRKDRMTIRGQLGDETATITLLHPLDCLRSRLANVNVLGRVSEHAVNQTVAAVEIVSAYVDHTLDRNDVREAQTTLKDLGYTILRAHLGRRTHVELGRRVDPAPVLERFADDERLDPRWRTHQLASTITKVGNEAQRRLAKRRTPDAPRPTEIAPSKSN